MEKLRYAINSFERTVSENKGVKVLLLFNRARSSGSLKQFDQIQVLGKDKEDLQQ